MSRLLTGIQSTGLPHLGNLIGAIKPMIAKIKQNKETAFCFIADLHTLTALRTPEEITERKKYTTQVAAIWIAMGLDPNQTILYRQSRIPEVTELLWYLSCYTSFGQLRRSHAYKDKLKNGIIPNAGLFIYPTLMTADIALFQATDVPVGEDQQQHIEIARNIIAQFNHQHGALLQLPQALINPIQKKIPGIDGRKMSKSYGNTLSPFMEECKLKQRIMSIPTDSTPLESPKDPDSCPIFQLYNALASPEKKRALRQQYLAGGMGYGHAKKTLFHELIDQFAEEKKKYDYYVTHAEELEKILRQGEEKARAIAIETIKSIREALHYN